MKAEFQSASISQGMPEIASKPPEDRQEMWNTLHHSSSCQVWGLILCVSLAGPQSPIIESNIILNISVKLHFGWDLQLNQWTLSKADYPS